MKNVTFIIFCLLFVTACNNKHLEIFPDLTDPTALTKKLTVKEMHHDMDAFIEGALARHPELSAYADLKSLKQALSEYKAELSEPLTRIDFYKVIGKLNHHLSDGHSLLIWPYQELNQLKESGQKLFPFDVLVTRSGEILIKHSYQYDETIITAGSKLISINYKSSMELLEYLQMFASGETRFLREQVVAERFAIGLWSALGFNDNFKIKVELDGNQAELNLTQEQQWRVVSKPKLEQAHYYQMIEEGVGFLYLAHFDISPDEFEDFVDSSFLRMKKDNINSLVIDIRDNQGGNTDTVTYLSRYLASKRFRMVSSVKEKLNHDNRGWFNYKGDIGDILTTEWNDWETPIANDNRFSGDVYLLVGSITYSASIVLATTLQDHKFATLIGQKTGGFSNQTAQGNLFNLPHSQLRAYIATRSLIRPSGEIGQTPVVPDYIVEPTQQSLQDGADTALEKALYLIKNGK